jgi:antitoxin (DNA-binding transcriptional repressor) of toxin-antitoxin stability system
MARESFTVIDIDDSEELSNLVDTVGEAGGPVILSRRGREVAILRPLTPESLPVEPLPRKEITEEDRAAFRAAAGSWAGNVDFEAWERARAESRALPSRPPVDLSPLDERE